MLSITTQSFDPEILLERAGAYLTENPSTIAWVLAAFILPNFFKGREIRRAIFWSFLAVAFVPMKSLLLLFTTAFVILGLRFGLKRVPEGSVGLVLRLGKYSRTLTPGLNFIFPGIESLYTPLGLSSYNDGERVPLYDSDGFVSTKETILNPNEIEMIGSDNTVVKVDSVLYFTITSPRKAAFNVEDLGQSLHTLVETILRQEVGRLDADALIKSRDVIGAKLQEGLSTASEPWGTRINRVEIESVEFANELQVALSEAREAELKGRASVVEAQRLRDAQIARAEGDKRAKELEAEALLTQEKLKAEGEYLRESRRREGEAQGLRAIAAALESAPETMVALEALKVQPLVAEGLGKSDGLLLIPNETAGILGAFGAAIKSMGRFKSTPSDGEQA